MCGLIETPVPTTSVASCSTELRAAAIELSVFPLKDSASAVHEAKSSPSVAALAARRTVSRSDCWPHSASQSRVSKGRMLPSLMSSVSLSSSWPSGCFSFHANHMNEGGGAARVLARRSTGALCAGVVHALFRKVSAMRRHGFWNHFGGGVILSAGSRSLPSRGETTTTL